MLVCSALLAIEAVVYKYLFESVSWSTGFVWTTLFSAVIIFSFLLISNIRQDIIKQASNLKRNAPIFAVEELLTFGGSAASTYVISLVSVTLEKSIEAFQPFFVLAYALVLGRFFPQMFHENIERRSLVKKFLLFVIMVVGIVLVV